jgi:hypothetical protein
LWEARADRTVLFMRTGSWRGWIGSTLALLLVLGACLGACASSEDCEFSDHCEGNVAVRCPGYARGALFGGEGHLEREECDNNRKCVESDRAGPTSDHRIPVADCLYSNGSK